MPSAPKKKKCRNCKGDGWVYVDADEPCYRCVYNDFDADKQKNCTYCSGKGYVVRKQGFLCCHCDSGWVYTE